LVIDIDAFSRLMFLDRLIGDYPNRIGVPFVDCKAKVKLFEQLRRENQFGFGTIAGGGRVRRSTARGAPDGVDTTGKLVGFRN
jgi:hypothetical protein